MRRRERRRASSTTRRAQKLKDANVDTVFMTLKNTFGTGLVQAADNIGYHPKWLLRETRQPPPSSSSSTR